MISNLTLMSFVKNKTLSIKVDKNNLTKRNKVLVIHHSKLNKKSIDELKKIFDPNNIFVPIAQTKKESKIKSTRDVKMQNDKEISDTHVEVKANQNKNNILPILSIHVKDKKEIENEEESFKKNIRMINKIKSKSNKKENMKDGIESYYTSRIRYKSTREKSSNNTQSYEDNTHIGSYIPKQLKILKKEKLLSPSEILFSNLYRDKSLIKYDKFAKIYHPKNLSNIDKHNFINNSLIYSLNRSISHNKIPKIKLEKKVIAVLNEDIHYPDIQFLGSDLSPINKLNKEHHKIIHLHSVVRKNDNAKKLKENIVNVDFTVKEESAFKENANFFENRNIYLKNIKNKIGV